ncbi:hypothetical protein G3N55_06750 [Dissulfurirhabdus thermomarina]|uniref:Sulfotransferase n=1 Tax=Dissulfurirhabdus thermomarina TaxID=1765737 RepID=A0A6N9TN22_DISTH|nr:hypothetical protein [Dissulfurirhabdus thermomarina]NDY42539.1 hypothetical protein [Dissulfurirhabdus thermomarina]NMX23539.1 hypothetical protein [Dissulfurirhabdus thermomarina]
MPLRLLVNGFFRSGTTIVWRILKESNPYYRVYYEPCHERLFLLVRDYWLNREADPLHETVLFDEYLLDMDFLDALRWHHPNVGIVFPTSCDELLSYVKLFHDSDTPIILQSNRWHFFLDKIAASYGCGVVHIVRNPFDVYRSIIRSSFRFGSFLKKILRIGLGPFIRGRFFYIDEMYKYIEMRYGCSPYDLGILDRILWRFKAMNRFFGVWIVSNFVALKKIQKVGGNVLCYEEIVRNPGKSKSVFESFGVHFDYAGKLRPANRNSFMTFDEEQRFLSIAKSIGLYEESLHILSRVIF